MPDREKVIKGLECIAQQAQDGTCDGCAYFRPFTDDPDCGWCDKVAIANDTLALLREQEPVEPTANDEAIRVKYNCGECGYLVGFVSTIHDDMQYRAKFCPECGRKVAWP